MANREWGCYPFEQPDPELPMRASLTACLFVAACALAVNADLAGQEKKQPPAKKGKVDPKAFRPDAATLKQIQEKTEELRKAVAALKEKKIADDVLVEVAIYLKAAENIVRFEEWLHANSVRWALQTLDQGLERAKQAEGGKAVWRDAPGKWVVRAYRSHIDDSIQPYAVLLPHDYGKDPNKKWRLDIVLHGRDSSLTEAKFIATHGTTAKEAPKDLGYVQLEPYGRGNNGYRWVGERDVFEAYQDFSLIAEPWLDDRRLVLRGFSMGGAGTWHIGLHHPGKFCLIGPGAGFTTTHGYVANLPRQLPDYQEKCLRIYDSYLYAENAFNVPVVAYSGEKDAQKKAADNIENALRGFKEPLKFTHLVAPGLEHQMPPEWQAKAENEYRKHATPDRDYLPDRVRFVTYTPRYASSGWIGTDWIGILALEATYEKAVIDAVRDGNKYTVTTSNVRLFFASGYSDPDKGPITLTIDGQKFQFARPKEGAPRYLEKVNGKWIVLDWMEARDRQARMPKKEYGLQGPIDDVFMSTFFVVEPTGGGWPDAALEQFASLWDRYFRGGLRMKKAADWKPTNVGNLILFGTPETNQIIAKVLPKLPIVWTKEKLVVNGVEYDPATHLPILIYPNPLNGNQSYVVLNSGHTFKEADLKGTNALLFPRLGDWAVIKPTPTKEDPAAYEVVAAGLFDENWQFKK
jgi:hypothetical protein